MHTQFQPLAIAVPCVGQLRDVKGQVQAEIRSFVEALDSYPARVAKERGLSFHQHLCSFLTPARTDRHARRQ